MNDGQIEQIDSPEQIYNKPSTRFVAEFMDPAAFIDIEIEDPHTLVTEIGKVIITDPVDTSDDNLQLLLRGNNVTLSPVIGTSTVDSVEFRGSHYSNTIRLQSGKVIEYMSQGKIFEVSQPVSVEINRSLPMHIYKNEKYRYSATVSSA